MSDDDSLLVEHQRPAVWALTVNRPARSNALDPPMISRLIAWLDDATTREDIRVVLLLGRGKHFCAGADLASDHARSPTGGGYSIVHLLERLSAFPKPTIALTQGGCVGAGAAIAACCDIVFADSSSFFSVPELRVGMAPLGVAPQIIRAIGERAFRKMAITGERMSASDALNVGLVHRIVAIESREAELSTLIDDLMHAAPSALRQLKHALNDGFKRSGLPVPEDEHSDERQEGIASFRSSRKPSWYANQA